MQLLLNLYRGPWYKRGGREITRKCPCIVTILEGQTDTHLRKEDWKFI